MSIFGDQDHSRLRCRDRGQESSRSLVSTILPANVSTRDFMFESLHMTTLVCLFAIKTLHFFAIENFFYWIGIENIWVHICKCMYLSSFSILLQMTFCVCTIEIDICHALLWILFKVVRWEEIFFSVFFFVLFFCMLKLVLADAFYGFNPHSPQSDNNWWSSGFELAVSCDL